MSVTVHQGANVRVDVVPDIVSGDPEPRIFRLTLENGWGKGHTISLSLAEVDKLVKALSYEASNLRLGRPPGWRWPNT